MRGCARLTARLKQHQADMKAALGVLIQRSFVHASLPIIFINFHFLVSPRLK
jgi:hypothetical protein